MTYNETLRRRERIWTLDVPRNVVTSDYTTSPDIFDEDNFDTSRLFRERLRDKYMTVDLVYENNSTRNKLVLESLGVKYRLSYR